MFTSKIPSLELSRVSSPQYRELVDRKTRGKQREECLFGIDIMVKEQENSDYLLERAERI